MPPRCLDYHHVLNAKVHETSAFLAPPPPSVLIIRPDPHAVEVIRRPAAGAALLVVCSVHARPCRRGELKRVATLEI